MRKGVMFSFIMIFITLSVLTLIALQNSLISTRREQIFIEMRINSMNNMYESMIKDVDKALKIISRRAISVAFSNVSVTEEQEKPPPLDEANETLRELILYGTLEGSSEPLMENATFTDWINKMKEISVLKGFDIDVNINSLEVKPYDYIHLLVKTELDINITEEQGVAEINRSIDVNSIVSLEGLEDPLYARNTKSLGSNNIKGSPYIGNYTQLLLVGSGGNSYVYGTVTNDIGELDDKILITHNTSGMDLSDAKGVIFEVANVTPVTIAYVINSSALSLIQNGTNVLLDGNEGKVWFIDNLIEDTENSYYHPSENGPSYLDRLEGRFFTHDKYESQSNYTIGLESFVDKIEISTFEGVPVYEEKTNIDYIYFDTSSYPTSKKVKGLDLLDPDPFLRIDNLDEHQKIYNVTELVY